MKVKGHGQAKVLNTAELQRLFTEGFTNPRDRALFGICLFTGCRISEALALEVTDIKCGTLTFRKSTTKGKLKTRQVTITDSLKPFLDDYQPKRQIGDAGFLFPGKQAWRHLSRYAADKLLRAGCSRIGVEGVSTHSFRRTALTQMHNAGIPLKHIQEISGHHDLGTLQAYLEVSTEQKQFAVSVIGW